MLKNSKKNTQHLDLENYTVVFPDQTYYQNQKIFKELIIKKSTKNIKEQPTEQISINALGVQ